MSGIIGYIIPFPDSKYYVQSLAGQGQKKVKSKKFSLGEAGQKFSSCFFLYKCTQFSILFFCSYFLIFDSKIMVQVFWMGIAPGRIGYLMI
jgi:hypothetical protein